jgi:hypothetical protein
MLKTKIFTEKKLIYFSVEPTAWAPAYHAVKDSLQSAVSLEQGSVARIFMRAPVAVKAFFDKTLGSEFAGALARKLLPGVETAGKNFVSANPNATEEAIRAFVRKAFSDGARAEIQAAEQAIAKAAREALEKAAAETAQRATAAAARKAAETAARQTGQALTSAVKQSAPRVLQSGTSVIRGLLPAATNTTTSLVTTTTAETGLVTAGETVATGVGAGAAGIALAGLAAVAAWSAVAWQGYELYSENSGGRGESRSTIDERSARQSAARYNPDDVARDTAEAINLMGNRVRGLSKVCRDATSNLLVESSMYGGTSVIQMVEGKGGSTMSRETKTDVAPGTKERVQNLIAYSEKSKAELEAGMKNMDKKSPEYSEAQMALAALNKALAVARKTVTNDAGVDPESGEYKDAKAAKERALLEREKVRIIQSIERMTVALGTLEGTEKDDLIKKLGDLKNKMPSIDKGGDFQTSIIHPMIGLEKQANDLMLKDGVKINGANKNEIIRMYLLKNIPADLHGNADYINRVWGMALAKAADGMTVQAFNAELKKCFSKAEFRPENMVTPEEYFKTENINGKKTLEGYVWDPFMSGYLVGLANRAKNHPALGSSSGAYVEELQKFLKDPKVQKEANNIYGAQGREAWVAYMTQNLESRNLHTPEAYFHYEETPAAKPAPAKPKRTPGPGRVADTNTPNQKRTPSTVQPTPATTTPGGKPPETAADVKEIDQDKIRTEILQNMDSALASVEHSNRFAVSTPSENGQALWSALLSKCSYLRSINGKTVGDGFGALSVYQSGVTVNITSTRNPWDSDPNHDRIGGGVSIKSYRRGFYTPPKK